MTAEASSSVLRLALRGYRPASWNRKNVTGWTRQQLAAEAHQHVIAALALLPQRPARIRGPFAVTAIGRFARQPLDPDNIRLKPAIDALRYAGVIDDDDYTRVIQVTVRSELAPDGEDSVVLEVRPVGTTIVCGAQLLREADHLRWEVARLSAYATRLRDQLALAGLQPADLADDALPSSAPPAGASPCGCVAWCSRGGRLQ